MDVTTAVRVCPVLFRTDVSPSALWARFCSGISGPGFCKSREDLLNLLGSRAVGRGIHMPEGRAWRRASKAFGCDHPLPLCEQNVGGERLFGLWSGRGLGVVEAIPGVPTPMAMLMAMPMLLPVQMLVVMWAVMGTRRPSPGGQCPPPCHGLSCGAGQLSCAAKRSSCAAPCCPGRPRMAPGAPPACDSCAQAQCTRPKRPKTAAQNGCQGHDFDAAAGHGRPFSCRPDAVP